MLKQLDGWIYLGCPHCGSGSDRLYNTFALLAPNETAECPSCRRTFTRVEAIDEMFLRGEAMGYALWTQGAVVKGFGRCKWGGVELLDVRGVFQDVYRVLWGMNGSCLAGGISARYMEQGYAMIAVAPDPEGIESAYLEVSVDVIGTPHGAPPLASWRAEMLKARLSARDQPGFAILASVSAVDLFFESLSGEEIEPPRPKSWGNVLRNVCGADLESLMGTHWADVIQMVKVRNAIAHGQDYIKRLDREAADKEVGYRRRAKCYEGEGAIAPVVAAALRSALMVVARSQRALEVGCTAPNGWVG